jgi:hypothetical protein
MGCSAIGDYMRVKNVNMLGCYSLLVYLLITCLIVLEVECVCQN